MTGEDDNPQSLEHLLPFYVTGTLEPPERLRLEAALAKDPALRQELAATRALRALVREGGHGLAREPRDAELRLRRLLARLGPASPRVLAPPGQTAARRFPWKMAFAASVAVLVGQGAIIAWQAAGPRQGYASLAGPGTSRPAADLLVGPAPDARWSELRALFRQRNLEIVGGPRDGILDVSVRGAATPDAEAQALRTSPLVDFVGVAR